jgi:hypothetical protein
MPSDHELDAFADLIAEILNHGTFAQHKALIEEIQIVGDDTEPAAADDTTVRTMGNLVGATGIEPVESGFARYGMLPRNVSRNTL